MKKSKERLDSTSVERIIMKIIAGHLGLAVSELHPENHLFDDFAADSLDQKEIIMTIEERFEIRLEDDKLKGLERIRDIVDTIQKHFRKKKEKEDKIEISENQNV